MAAKKRIGILTSGGDCAALNAAIRAATLHAIRNYGWQVLGIHDGTSGFLRKPCAYEELTLEICDERLLRAGGTILGTTNKDNPFNFPLGDGTFVDRSNDFIQNYHTLGLDALIGIGGDGSMRILRKLAQQGGLNLVTIPKTIDNDLGQTEIAIGHMTAIDVATEALDRLQTTAASHQRVMILEVMGRDAGHIAISAGVAGGADVILVPEVPYKLSDICEKIRKLAEAGRQCAIVIVAESVKRENGSPATVLDPSGRPRYSGIGHYLGEKLQTLIGADTRVTVLGHLQRGGQPSAWDRAVASAFGVKAVDLIAAGSFDRMVAWQNMQVIDVPIEGAIDRYRNVDPSSIMLQTAKSLGIYVGLLPC